MFFHFTKMTFLPGAILGLLAGLASGTASADSVTSSCAATTVNSPLDNTCYTITPTLTDPAGIVIDGLEDPAWAAAQSKDLVGNITGEVKAMRSGDDLYLLIRVDDNSLAISDEIRIYMDPLHSHESETDDVRLRMTRDLGAGGNLFKTTSSFDGAWDPSLLGSEVGQQPSLGGAIDWTVEVRLTAAEFDLSDQPAIMSFGIEGEDLLNGDITTWPEDFDSTDPTETWANVKMRYPVDYMIVLDYSGSMLSQDKWEDAKQAANFLANTMAIFRDPVYFTDRIGLVTFSTLCGGGAQTVTAILLAQVAEAPGDYTGALVDPISNNCTPIGDGLAEAFGVANLDATRDNTLAETQRGILLLSDGLQNEPGPTFLPSDTGYQACSNTLSDVCPESNVQVDTVAFGEGDWFVDTDLLSDIKNHYAGIRDSTFTLVSIGPELIEPFIASLENFFRLNLVSTSAGPVNFSVNPNEHRLAVIHAWDVPGSAQQIQLQLGLDIQDANCPPPDLTVGMAYCVIDNPAEGVSWSAVRDSDGAVSTATQQFVLIDLTLRARFSIDRVLHGTGQDIVLTADLRDGGRPILHDPTDHPVTVTVDIETPEEGFGTFASTTEPDTCDRIDPTLPKFDPQRQPTHGLPVVAGQQTAADPSQPHFTLMSSLLEACDKDGLDREEDPGIEMRDDGTQGDAAADDGIYTLRFTGADTEGTYNFRFAAEGVTASGDTFTRVRSFSEYVRVEVDPAETAVGSRDIQLLDDLVIREYNLLPKDGGGQFLGPGHADQIAFFATDGQWAGPVQDYNNGYYARILAFDPRRGEPLVTPVIQGKPIFPDIKDRGGWEHKLWWIWLIVIIILMAIILLLWLKLWRLSSR